MSAPRVSLYTTRSCGYCHAARRLLESGAVPFEEFDMTGRYEELAELKRRTGPPTVPQVFVDGALLGGYDDLAAHIGRHGMDSLRPLPDPEVSS